MNRLQSALAELAGDFAELDTRWALVGGLALAAHVEARTTRDLDVVVSVADDRQAEQLVRDLRSKGYNEHTLVEQERTGRLATVRFAAPGEPPDGLVVDLLFASSGIEPEIVSEAERLEVLPGLFLPVARVGYLLAMKILAARPQDLEDVRSLLGVADGEELARAHSALELITQRGYHREQDLAAEAERLLGDREHGQT